MTFNNGWTVSVQFGLGNYCENRDGTRASSKDAEIAAWDRDGNWYHFPEAHDDVKGRQTPNQVLQFMCMIASKA
jgi:hypothetical protein